MTGSNTLTKQQACALEYLRREGEAPEWGLWEEGIRPWPTFDNLVAKGLAENVGYEYLSDEECGWVYRLTPAGERVANGCELRP